MTVEELLKRFAAGERRFNGSRISAEDYEALLDGRSLSGINLCGGVLSGNWSGVNLSSALLYGVKGEGWDLQKSNLSMANLRGTLFAESNLTGCNFSNACLSGTYFTQVLIDEVDFNQADLRGANFSETSFCKVNLSGADLSGAKGIDMDILKSSECILTNLRMPDGNIFS